MNIIILFAFFVCLLSALPANAQSSADERTRQVDSWMKDASPAIQDCAREEKSRYERGLNWFPKIRDKGSPPNYTCSSISASFQEMPPKQCCDTYYATRNNPGMWDESWYVLQECGWKNEIDKRRVAYYKKAEECLQKHPMGEPKATERGGALFHEVKHAIEANRPIQQAIRDIAGKNAFLAGMDERGNFYIINNQGKKIAIPDVLAGKFDISKQLAILLNDLFVASGLPSRVVASSEHGSIRGTINGGGDFLDMQSEPPPMTGKNEQQSILLAYRDEEQSPVASDQPKMPFLHASAAKPAEPVLISTPSAKTTLAGRAVIDVAHNGITGLLVLEGKARVREVATGEEREIPAGSAVMVVPGYGIGNTISASGMQVNRWWEGQERLARLDSRNGGTMLTGTWTMQDERNKLNGTLSLQQNGSKVQGVANLSKGPLTVRGDIVGDELHLIFIHDNVATLTYFISEELARQIVGITSKAVMRLGKDPGRIDGTYYGWQVDNEGNRVTQRYEGGTPEAARINAPRGFTLVRTTGRLGSS